MQPQPIPSSLILRLTTLALMLTIIAGGIIAGSLGTRASHTQLPGSPTISGCHLFPANNIWNYNISHLPLRPRSANYIKALNTDTLQHDFGYPNFAGFPYVVVSGAQPKVPVHFRYASESDPGPYPIPPDAPIEGRTDRHVLVLDRGTCKLYELWESSHQSDGSWNAGSGAIFDLNSNRLRPHGWTSADAAGLPILPGLVRYDEVAAGAIKHALRGAIRITQNRYLWPARHTDGANADSYALPFGLRLRLKSSVNISSFPSQSRVILTALRHYGMFVADKGGSNWYSIALSGAPDPHWNKSDLVALTRVHASDFEVVNESSLQVSPDSGQTRAGVTATSPTPVPTPRPTKAPTVSPLASPVPTTATVLTREEVVGSDNSKVSKTSGGGWTNMPLFILAGLTFLLSLTILGIRHRNSRKRTVRHSLRTPPPVNGQ